MEKPITRIHPETGEILRRDVRKIETTYKGETIIHDMPGWYPADNDNGIYTREDMKFSDEALEILKERVAQKERTLKSA